MSKQNASGINLRLWLQARGKTLTEFSVFVVLFLVVHAIALRYVFPGYYDPFWPHHSDYYIATALAYSPEGFWPILQQPRTIGYAFLWLIGHFHTRGAILAALLLVAANYAVIVMIVRRIFQITLFFPIFAVSAVFAYLLAVHPFQYELSTWDVFSQLSLLFLLVATAMYLSKHRLWKVVIVTFAAFIVKETYVASAGMLAGLWFFLHFRREGRLALAPLLIVLGTFILAFIVNRVNGSVFVSGALASPYQIVLRPTSVISEWIAYLFAGVNAMGFAVIFITAVTTAIVFGRKAGATITALALPVAGALAWLPNSVLPNHHFDAYSWNGAYLLYAPVLLLAMAYVKGGASKFLVFVVAIAALGSPVLSSASYSKSEWILMNQKRQKLLMGTLGGLIKHLPQSGEEAVLISGINFPFSPFDHWPVIYSMNPPAGVKFYVVYYREGEPDALTSHGLPKADGIVRMISPSQVPEFHYDQIWLIKSNGGLIKSLHNPDADSVWSDGPVASLDALKYPDLLENFGPGNKAVASGVGEGYRYLGCGSKLLSYNELRLAEKCLRRSVSIIPESPYPYFFLGSSLERQGRIPEARAAYMNAVRREHNSPNPLFKEALSSLK